MNFFRILCYLVVMVTMRTTTNPLNNINAFVPNQILIISNKRLASIDTSSSVVDQTHSQGARRLLLLLQVGTSKETEIIPQFRPGSLEEATAKMGKVPYGEASRRYRRTEFVYDDWVKHRTSEKIFTNLNGLLYSGIVRQLKEELFYISLSAAFVVGWDDFLLPFTAAHTQDLWMISTLPRLCIPALPFQLCSPALGLLLVFKTNASYARWLEARNTWAKVITQARNMVRMAATFVPNTEEGKRSIQKLSDTMWLLCRSIMHDLSGPNDEGCFRDQVTAKFEDGDGEDQDDLQYARKMIESSERSMTALALASAALDSVPIDEKRRVEIDKSLVIIGDCIGIFEKIYSAPVPLVYTRHTGRFLSLYMLLLPVALHDVFLDKTLDYINYFDCLLLIPTTAILGLFLFGIDELAIQLEEPFSILPMQNFCDKLQKSTKTITDCLE